MGGGDSIAVYLGFHGEPQDFWWLAIASRVCYSWHVFCMGLDVSAGCLTSAEQVEDYWCWFLLWLLPMCFLL